MKEKQSLQEEQYSFPYHFLVQKGPREFSQTKTLTWGYEYQSYIDRVLDLVKDTGGSSLIDIGCGEGKFIFEAHWRLPHLYTLGIDYSDRVIQLAKSLNPQLNFKTFDITQNKLEREFDLAVAIEVFEHVPPENMERFVRGIADALKKSGVLVLTVPSTNIPTIDKHFQHFNSDLMQKTMNSYFNIEKIEYVNKKGIISSIIRRLFGNRLFTLNHPGIGNFFYNFYLRTAFKATHNNGKRLVVICKKI